MGQKGRVVVGMDRMSTMVHPIKGDEYDTLLFDYRYVNSQRFLGGADDCRRFSLILYYLATNIVNS